MNDEAFTVRLDKSDWNAGMGGWRCPALKIPSASIGKIYVAGKPVDGSYYQLTSDGTIRWIPENPPSQISVLISLNESLSLKSDTDFWKRLTVVVPVIAALITGVATYVAAPKPPIPGPGPATAHLLHLRVDPIELGAKRILPAPVVTINGTIQRTDPVNYSVSTETTAIVDVTDALNFTRELRSLSEQQRRSLQIVVDGSDTLISDLQKVAQIIDKNCIGGERGIPAGSNPAVLAITSRAATGISTFKAAAASAIATPLPRVELQ